MTILRKYGWMVAAWTILVLPATLPLWQPEFLFSEDGPLHLWRIAELDRALRQGTVYPRWAPDVYFGYGSPVFNFYSPLSYYIGEFLHFLGLDLQNAIKITLACFLLLGAMGAFLLARSLFASLMDKPWQREWVGFVTAAAFVYSPYFLVDIYVRAALGEALAMALLPLCVWAVRRLVFAPNISNVLLAGLLAASLVLSHQLTALFALPVVAGYVLILLVFLPSRDRLHAVMSVTASGWLAAALGAFFWLPMLVEMRLVNLGVDTVTRGELLRLVTDQLLSLGDLVQPQWIYNYPEDAFPLALAAVALGITALLAQTFLLKSRVRTELAYWAVVAFVAGIGMTDAARPLWVALPALQTIVFPWRLSLFVTLSLALAVGLWVVFAARIGARGWLTGAVGLVLLVNSIAVGMLGLPFQPWYVPPTAISSLGVMARYEVNAGGTGMSLLNTFLPVWVNQVPVTDPDAKCATPGSPIVTAPVQIQLESVSPDDWRLVVDAAQPAAIALRTFYYPDWHATIDGHVALIRPSSDAAILTVDVPAGQHTVQLTHSSLPGRDIGIVLTSVGVLACIVGIAIAVRRGEHGRFLPVPVLGALVLVFAFPQTLTFSATVPRITPTQVNVDDTLRLVGFSIERLSGETLPLTLYWLTQSPIEQEVPTRIQLTDASGRVWVTDSQWPRFGTGGSCFWVPNEIITDLYELYLPPALPGGRFTLQVARGDAPFVTVGTVELPSTPPRPSAPGIDHPVQARFGESIELVGFNAPSLSPARPGDVLDVTLYWQAIHPVPEDFTVLFQLLDSQGQLVAQRDSMPDNSFSPTMLWHPGQLVADHRPLRLPSTLLPGLYHLVAGLYRFENVERLPVQTEAGASPDDLVTLTTIKVPPTGALASKRRLQADFGPAIRLVGFALKTPQGGKEIPGGGTAGAPARWMIPAQGDLDLTLEWLARRAPGNDYTVSVQLLDSSGQLVRQQDRPPVDGHYPTGLWEMGEEIVDPYTLTLSNLPAGTYMLAVAMYSPISGQRLAAVDSLGKPLAANQVVIGEIDLTSP